MLPGQPTGQLRLADARERCLGPESIIRWNEAHCQGDVSFDLSHMNAK